MKEAIKWIEDYEDVEPDRLIVRCKDCRYYVPEQNGCKRLRELVKSEGHCMWAEKREADHDSD